MSWQEAYKKHESAALGKRLVFDDSVPTDPQCLWCQDKITSKRYESHGLCITCFKRKSWVIKVCESNHFKDFVRKYA